MEMTTSTALEDGAGRTWGDQDEEPLKQFDEEDPLEVPGTSWAD